MECPKCQHVIHINLTPEELVYCPYCNQRMIPPKDYNLCPACGEEMPLGAATCENCARKAGSSEQPVVDAQPNPTPPPAAEIVEPVSAAEIIETAPQPPPEMPEEESPLVAYTEPIVQSQAVKEQTKKPIVTPEPAPIPVALTEEEPVVASPEAENEVLDIIEPLQRPDAVEALTIETVVTPATMPTLEPAIGEELPVIPPRPVAAAEYMETTIRIQVVPVEVESNKAEEPPPPAQAEAEPEPVEEAPSASDILLQLSNGIAPKVKLAPPAGFAELLEAARAPKPLDESQTAGVCFCYACGQKLPPGALFCLRCGKSMQINATPVVARETAVELKQNLEPAPAAVTSPAVEQAPAPPPIPPAAPKFRPVASREPVEVAMQDVAPSLPHFPKEKTSPDTFDIIWEKVAGWATEAWRIARSLARRIWIQIKILSKPAPPKERPLIDLSSAEVLKSKRVKAPARAPVLNPTMLVYMILGLFLFVAIFVIIGIAMTR